MSGWGKRRWAAAVVIIAVAAGLTALAWPLRPTSAPRAVAGPGVSVSPRGSTTPGSPSVGPTASSPSGLNPAFGIAAGSGLTSMDDAELARYLDETVSLGGAWIRFDVDWSQVEAAGPGHYEWAATDRVVAAAQARGLSQLAVIGYAPAWAAAANCDSNHCAPREAADFGQFAGTVAARYRDAGLRHFEIWNEPNVTTFFAPRPSVEAYSELLEAAAGRIRGANPQAFVLSGGTAPAASDGENLSPLDFIRELYIRGSGRFVDAVAHHPYTYPYMPSNAYPGGAWDDLRSIHEVMAAGGDGAKLVWATEYGAPTGGRPQLVDSERAPLPAGEPVSERLQAAMAKSAVAAYRRMGWTGPMLWYSLRDAGGSPNDPEGHFGLLRTDGSHKAAYDAVRQAWDES